MARYRAGAAPEPTASALDILETALPKRLAIFVTDQPRWWQWPTVLSLDAPTVSVLWQILLARAAGVTLGWSRVFVLGASVWLAYVADRWLEAGRLDPGRVRTKRHGFYQHRRRTIGAAWLAVLAVDVAVALAALTTVELTRGLVLLAAVLAYVLSHQLWHRDYPWRVPKEVCSAALLTGGVAVFVLTASPATVVLPLVAFGWLCFSNTTLISAWEREVDRVHGQTSLALQFRFLRPLIHVLPWSLALIAVVLARFDTGPTEVALACAGGSSVLLGAVDLFESRAGWPLARVLADAALLTPLLPLLRGG